MVFVISSDSHHVAEYTRMKWGARQAQRGWVDRDKVANTWDVERFLDCCVGDLLAGSWMRGEAWTRVQGRRALRRQVEVASGEYAQEILVIELDGRRVMLVVSESPSAHRDVWLPWFRALLGTLEIWEEAG